MNFVFLSPNFPENYYHFTQGLKANGVSTFGVGDAPYEELREELRQSLDDYYKVSDLENYDEVYRAVAFLTHKYGRIDFLESNNEYWLERDASLRTDFNIKGLNEETIKSIRYKSGMKAVYEKAGCKVARYHLTNDLEAGFEFVKKVGYPVIVKPDNGMGAATTFKINNEEELKDFYKTSYPYQMIMEEFVCGDLLSYDGIADSNKNVVFETQNIYPTPIMDIVNEQKDTYFYSLKEVETDVRDIGQRVVKAFDTNSRFFHCEYFRLTQAKEGLGEVGDIVGLEVNMRPPGGNAPDVMNFARQINVYQLWANMIAFDDAKYDLNHPSCHAVFSSRRDAHHYDVPLNEVVSKYEGKIYMNQRCPEALAGAMGNDILIGCFDTMEEVYQFVKDVNENH
ncbi:ATP-grasp domain-containing protein [Tannockella kyphosi]|uniref:ATP-grasp domain-containing protein n=1 Tax=Tannockella kyphosi TaxID=2899121 RepID=UPI0020115AFC|nr:ATP-grasp domain-containing protein [Tannockella kyphosi]